MDLQYVALQIYLHKGVDVEYAYAMAHEFLEYKIIYDKTKREIEQNRQLNEHYSRMRENKVADSDPITEDVFLSKHQPF